MGIFDKGVDPAEYEKFRAWAADRIACLEERLVVSASESAVDAQNALGAARKHKADIEALAAEMLAAIDGIRKAKTEID